MKEPSERLVTAATVVAIAQFLDELAPSPESEGMLEFSECEFFGLAVAEGLAQSEAHHLLHLELDRLTAGPRAPIPLLASPTTSKCLHSGTKGQLETVANCNQSPAAAAQDVDNLLTSAV